MDAITNRLQELGLLDRVTVGTAHAYQGDERDIMIFSPVVARGISEGAARWVENPKNLINVAVTRARTGLLVVADFDVCRAQPGILGELIKYVDTIERLRKESAEELELFSWMVVQGWRPDVHLVERDMEIDFVLRNAGMRLAIEVDGSQHENTTEQDRARDAFLRGRGYDVLRVPGRAVRETPSLVIKQIAERTGLPL
jgi:very-short-patch-repair endonuclease